MAAVVVMAIRTRVVAVVVATGEASRIVGAVTGAVEVVTTEAVVAMNPEAVEVAEEAEAAWGRCLISQGVPSVGNVAWISFEVNP